MESSRKASRKPSKSSDDDLDVDTTPRKMPRQQQNQRGIPEEAVREADQPHGARSSLTVEKIYGLLEDMQEQIASIRYEQLQIRKQIRSAVQSSVQPVETTERAVDQEVVPTIAKSDTTKEQEVVVVEASKCKPRAPESECEKLSACAFSDTSSIEDSLVEESNLMDAIMAVQKRPKPVDKKEREAPTTKRIAQLTATFPCMSKYHTGFSEEMRHASKECCFCSKCHILETLFNSDSDSCKFSAHTPTEPRIQKILDGKPDALLLQALKRFDEWKASGNLEPEELDGI